MAEMIPNLDPKTIENNGERLFYSYASLLPHPYTVLYSFKFPDFLHDGKHDIIREADFVIVHPQMGFLVVEVKQGDIRYHQGEWLEFKNGDYSRMHKDPLQQAENSMHAIRNLYCEKRKRGYFPLKIRYALAFPECCKLSGDLPPNLREDSVFLFPDLEHLNAKITALFDQQSDAYEETRYLIDKILAPSFSVFAKLEDKFRILDKTSQLILTEEQARILEETELDQRKIFLGAAGTGKTYLAREKALRAKQQGKRVLLTCYNRNLTRLFEPLRTHGIVVGNFHDVLIRLLNEYNIAVTLPEDPHAHDGFFRKLLPETGFDYFTSAPDSEKFDCIIVDEGQDFQAEWYDVLESMLRPKGEFYIFADPNQNLFGADPSTLHNFTLSKQKLSINLRNVDTINQWLGTYLSTPPKSKLTGGFAVQTFAWRQPHEEKSLIKDEIGRLVSQGVSPYRITILSPNKKEKSCLAGADKIGQWSLTSFAEPKPGAITFATIRSFKGLEADIVFLIGLKNDPLVCGPMDIYVGASRARFLLYVFHEENWQKTNPSPSIATGRESA